MHRVRHIGRIVTSPFTPSTRTEIGPPAPLPEPTPIFITPRTRLVLLVLCGILIYLFAISAPNVVRLFLVGSTVALILSFPVRFLQRFMSRGIAILVVALSTFLLAIVSLALLIPFAVSEISDLADSLPATVDDLQGLARDVLDEFYRRGWMEQRPEEVLNDLEAGIFDAGQQIAADILANLVSTLTRSVNILITTFGVIFVSIYLLIDIPRFKETFVRMFAPAYRQDARILWDTVGYSLSRYLGGLLISITIQGIMATIGLSLLGIPYALILGLWMSATAILPYVGAFLGAIPSVAIALTMSWQLALATVVLYVLINQLEANFITPRIQGSAVRVHPLLIFFAVIAGSNMFGPLGAIMAVPVLAVLRVLGEFFWLRLRVRGDHDTLLSAMRSDLAEERIANQTPIAEIIEDEAAAERAGVASDAPSPAHDPTPRPDRSTPPAP
ncbi:MAG TPA: AI-2E family transporter [Thermomicrobiales bacterium]|jgi:predicted PurR-regulated permease PerM|nr:AI-2E family transporter [Thermomicrobiales bacterium]